MIVRVMATVVIVIAALWGTLALWYQLPGGHAVKAVGVVIWVAVSSATVLALWQGRALPGLTGFAVVLAALLLWWQHQRPSNAADWADDVAQMTTGKVEGNHVTLHNVRDFEWRSDSDYTQRWTSRSYDLERLRSVDMIMSYWAGPVIAHMIVSFGFDDGEQLAFSVEVRRRRGEEFSEIGGFFRQFNLSIVAADERDVVRVRTNVRGEDDYIYRLNLPRTAVRSLLLAYVEQANTVAARPRFYNTIDANCTSLVYQMMTHIVGHLPLDYRLLLTGYLPQYVYELGGLMPGHTLEELRQRGRITDRAKAADRSASFSADIRHGIPGVSAAGPD